MNQPNPSEADPECDWRELDGRAVRYYPALQRAFFPSTRAALEAIGCTPEVADRHFVNADARDSELVAVPLAEEEFKGATVALVHRDNAERVTLWPGIPELSCSNYDRALEVLALLSKAVPGHWFLCESTNHGSALQ